MDYSSIFSTKVTPQTEPIPGKDQVENNAGGYIYSVDKWTQLNRFLILGSEGGTYYVSERKLTKENAQNVIECIKEDADKVIKEIVSVITQAKAPKPDPSIFTLALILTFADPAGKKAGYDIISTICKTSTHLFTLCRNIKNLRGWSAGLRRGVSKFYLDKTPEQVRYQLIKYRKRNGWTHRDVLRLCHAKTCNPQIKSLFSWVSGKGNGETTTTRDLFLEPLEMFASVKPTKDRAMELITKYGLPWEVLPTEYLNDTDVCEKLLPHMGMTALLRNLARLTVNGTLEKVPWGNTQSIIARLTNPEEITKSKVHPIAILLALKTYAQGTGFKGSLTWEPIQCLVDALNQGFYLSFKNISPTNKKIIIGLDVSGSMGEYIHGTNLSHREATSAMAMMLYKTEKMVGILGFCDNVVPLNFGAFSRLDDIVKQTEKLPFSSTDCAQPILWAKENNIPVDCFIIFTDNETYAGKIHPTQALAQYRKEFNSKAKMIVCATDASKFSIADPNDKGMLDICGFDATIPTLINDFIRGDLIS